MRIRFCRGWPTVHGRRYGRGGAGPWRHRDECGRRGRRGEEAEVVDVDADVDVLAAREREQSFVPRARGAKEALRRMQMLKRRPARGELESAGQSANGRR